MQSLTSLIVLFFLVSCSSNTNTKTELELPVSQSKIGIGLIHFNLNEPIPLYKNEKESIPFDTLKFIFKKSGNDRGVCLFKTVKIGNKLKPYILSQGDSDKEAVENRRMGLFRFLPEIVFTVTEKSANGVKIIIDKETCETVYVKINPQNDLRINTDSNPNYFDPNFVDSKISNWFYYETWEQALKRAWKIYVDEDIDVFDAPNGKKILVEYQDISKVDSVKGDWARVTNRFYNMNERKIFGWVKWKDNDSVKVGIRLNGGYK